MSDSYSTHGTGLESPASHAFYVTPSDTADVAATTRAIYVGTGGDLAVTMLSGATITLHNLPGACLLPLRASRVLAPGTTAAQLVGLN
jgi:hypothetical protein